MNTIEELVNDAFALLFPYEAEREATESAQLRKAALHCYLLLAMHIGEQSGLAQARAILVSHKSAV